MTAGQPKLWKNRAGSLNDRARMYQALGRLTASDLKEIVRRDRSRCIYCDLTLDYDKAGDGGPLAATFDHIIRLCDGGSNTYENVACACRTCNQLNNKRSIENPTEAALQRLHVFLGRKPGPPAIEAAA